MLKSAALLLPVALAGLYAGSRLRTRVAPARLQRLIFLLLAVAGAGRSIAGGCRLRDGAVAASGMRSYPRDGARAAAPRRPHAAYFAVGMANSAPLAMLSGQRCMMDFCLV